MKVCAFPVINWKIHLSFYSRPWLHRTFLPLKFLAWGHDIECQGNIKESHHKKTWTTMGNLPLIAFSRENKKRLFILFVKRKAQLLWTIRSLECPSRWTPYFLFLCVFFFFWLCHTSCEILVPQPGTEPGPWAVWVQSPNHWTAREFLLCYLLA